MGTTKLNKATYTQFISLVKKQFSGPEISRLSLNMILKKFQNGKLDPAIDAFPESIFSKDLKVLLKKASHSEYAEPILRYLISICIEFAVKEMTEEERKPYLEVSQDFRKRAFDDFKTSGAEDLLGVGMNILMGSAPDLFDSFKSIFSDTVEETQEEPEEQQEIVQSKVKTSSRKR